MTLAVDPFVSSYLALSEKAYNTCGDFRSILSELADPFDRLETASKPDIEFWLRILAAFFDHRSEVVYNGDYRNEIWQNINSLRKVGFSTETCGKWLGSLLLARWFVLGAKNVLGKYVKNKELPTDDKESKALIEKLLVSSGNIKELISKASTDIDRCYVHEKVKKRPAKDFRSIISLSNMDAAFTGVSKKGLLLVGDDYIYAERLEATVLTKLLKQKRLITPVGKETFEAQVPRRGIVVTDEIEIDAEQIESKVFYFVSYKDEKYVVRKTEAGSIEIFEVVE